MGNGAVVPDLAWKHEGITYGMDVRVHNTVQNSTLAPLIAMMDARERNGHGTIDTPNAACAATTAATEATNAAATANAPNLPT